jgi:hypothetical protein
VTKAANIADDACEWESCKEAPTLTSRLDRKCRRWCENHSFTFASHNPKAQWARDQVVKVETEDEDEEEETETQTLTQTEMMLL